MSGRALRISLAGGCSIAAVEDEREALPVGTRQGRLVLARLAVAQAPVSQDELADLLWPDALPSSWERHLSAVVSKLRRLLRSAPGPSGAAIVGRPGCYELQLPPGSVVDVVEAADGVRRARTLLADGRLDEALTTASAAADTARRPFLSGSEALWVDEQRDALRAELIRALEVVVEVAVERRDPAGLSSAREAVAVDPYRETSYRHLMRLQLAIGERRAVAKTYDRYCALVGAELHMTPSAELEDLRRAAVEGSIEPTESPRTSLGNGFRTARGRLPVATTSFVGRTEELADVTKALERSRLVTLTGTAGVGKSRLALEAAHRLAHRHPDGACLCELAHVADPSGVAFAVAASVGVRQRQGATIEEGLIEALANQNLLVVVDNCEHLLDAIAPMLERVVRYCRDVRVLTTSRERLGAEGEVVVEVSPLAVPDERSDSRASWDQPAPALELLRDRIADVRPGFRPDARQREALVDVARRLDGLPLALELAAARMAAMGPVEVDRRLDRRFALLDRGRRTALARHRTLLAAVEWSYDLLDEVERRAFERASVFIGGFTLNAAENICAAGAGVRGDEVASAVAALVDKSMLIIDDSGRATRYRMLETLREFGAEHLSARGELAAIEEAHARHFTTLAWEAEQNLRGPAEPEWVTVLEAELSNFRAAHAWAMRSGNRGVAAELSAALFWFGHWRMHTEVLTWADQLADGPSADMGPHRSRVVAAAGDGAWRRGDLSRARALGDRSVAVAEGSTDARYGWHVLSAVAMFEGRLEDSAAASQQVAELARRDGDHFHAVVGLGNLAVARGYSGDTSTAVETARASRDEAERSGSPSALAWSAYASGEVIAATNPKDALTFLDRAVELADTVEAHFIRGVALLSATSLRARHGDPSIASHALVRIIDHWEQAGNWRQQWVTLRSAVELLARLGNDEAAATVLGAIDAHDAANIYGADAERLSVLQAELGTRLGPLADERLAEGHAISPADVVAFTRRQLGA